MEETTPQTPEKKSMSRGLIIAIFIVIIALAIVGYEITKEEAMTVTTYKNGTYNVVGSYTSPGGAEEIDVTITLKDDVITDAKVVPKAERPISKEKQGIFIENFKPQVVGKKIDEVKLDKVSSSSLTPKGFNDALEKVKEEAKA